MNRTLLALIALASWQSGALAQQPPSEALPSAGSASSVEGLRRDLSRIIEEPNWSEEGYGVLVVSLDRGDTLFALNPDRPLAPASNVKLFSTAAALYYLGPEYRYSTYLFADGPIRDGVLEGDLILYGTGDPAISGRMLEGPNAVTRRLVDELVALGVREVRGDVVGDGSYFDAEWTGPGWQENDLDAWYGAPVGALSFAENVVSIRFSPTREGAPAAVSTAPATSHLALDNRVVTVRSGSNRVSFERRGDRLVAIGQVRIGTAGIARSLPVVDPANFAAAAVRALLQERGISVAGDVRTVRSAADSRVSPGGSRSPSAPRVVAEHRSPPLSQIVAVTNHVSHNLFAEALLKTVGRAVHGEGSFEAGARAVDAFLEKEVGRPSGSISQVDGSGLSRNNLLTARTTVHLLDYMPRSGVWESYFESLPRAAVPNGLEQRMRGTAAAGNLRAKTGTIRNVSALSGYVTSADGERLAFSVLANGVPSTARAKRSEDAIGARLAAFSRSASAAVASGATAIAGRGPSERSRATASASTPSRVHRVAAGETLEAIARRYGLTVAALRRANPSIEPRRLQVGQRVTIPSG